MAGVPILLLMTKYVHRCACVHTRQDTHTVEVQLEWQITKKHNHGGRENVTQVYDVHVYNLVSRALGLPQIHLPKSYSMESQMDDNIPFNFFTPLSGNVLFSIEGLHSGMFCPRPTSTLQKQSLQPPRLWVLRPSTLSAKLLALITRCRSSLPLFLVLNLVSMVL
jgi:hypothetical protein